MAFVNIELLKKELNDFRHTGTSDPSYDCGYHNCLNWVRDVILNLPTEDVAEVKHGYWIYLRTHYEADECNCSLCGQLMTTARGVRMKYCPNCGNPMDGKKPKESEEL